VANTTDKDVWLPVGSPLAPLETVEVRSAFFKSGDQSDQKQYEHLQPLWETMGSALPDSEEGTLDKLPKQYSSVFSTGEMDLGRATAVQHRINTGSAQPVRQALRRQPIAWQAEIDRQIQQMEEQGLIYPCLSEWAANLVVVKKRWQP